MNLVDYRTNSILYCTVPYGTILYIMSDGPDRGTAPSVKIVTAPRPRPSDSD
jgi:hypothetical protein